MTLRINTARLGRRPEPAPGPPADDEPDNVRPLRRLRQLAPNDPRRSELNPDFALIDGVWQEVTPVPLPVTTEPKTYDHSGTDHTAFSASDAGRAAWEAGAAESDPDPWGAYLAARQDWGPDLNATVDAYLASLDRDQVEAEHDERLDRYLADMDHEYAEQLARRAAATAEINTKWAAVEAAATAAIENRRKDTAA